MNVSMTSPASGAVVSGTTTVSPATASGTLTLAGVQFTLDGVPLGAVVSGTGPSYNYSWDTTTATNGTHTLAAIVTDTSGDTATSSSTTVTVNNTTGPAGISGVSASGLTSSGATISWATTTASSSQVNYGLSSTYGSSTAVVPTLVTTHSVVLSGLTPSTAMSFTRGAVAGRVRAILRSRGTSHSPPWPPAQHLRFC